MVEIVWVENNYSRWHRSNHYTFLKLLSDNTCLKQFSRLTSDGKIDQQVFSGAWMTQWWDLSSSTNHNVALIRFRPVAIYRLSFLLVFALLRGFYSYSTGWIEDPHETSCGWCGVLSKILCTCWLSGRAGREKIWLEVHTSWPRAKYFPVWSDLTQSISILSYDHLLLKILKILFEPK